MELVRVKRRLERRYPKVTEFRGHHLHVDDCFEFLSLSSETICFPHMQQMPGGGAHEQCVREE